MQAALLGAVYTFAALNLLLLTARGVVAIATFSRRFLTAVCRAQTRLLWLLLKPAVGLLISYAIHRYWTRQEEGTI